MKTLRKHLEMLKADGKTLIVPYIMAGDHARGIDGLPEMIAFLAATGASAIEVGIPFSDPVADGPVIELAGIRSLKNGTTLTKVVEVLKTVKTDVPLVIMSYLNPIYKYGIEKFITDLKSTAVKGLILPDVPREHENMIAPFLTDSDIALVPLVTLTSIPERQAELVKDAEGFIYAVTVNGVTGADRDYRADLNTHLAQLSELADAPVLAGFGVSSLAHVENFRKAVDGVIVGSYIVKALNESRDDEVADFLKKASLL
ncbi:tryptophan synthase alpha chain [Lactococcus hodotermopsidis]|uniref:Tryptophan synthase alpha chain n=1 Tax=Pseudolactococcus hodotermopsidis TaxID=2709157 RepID=A0A6A0B9Z0_9LACT|nr:tryptophan synthase subunit alpha [Lactococcus hodotermopsidis]GFH42192.1 tryptophan synthase alpha chain [Lactococcus hodotermopsidis]